MVYSERGARQYWIAEKRKGSSGSCGGKQDAKGDRQAFMIQTTSRRIPMRPAMVAVVTGPAVAVATVAVAAAAAVGSGLHRCEGIPLGQESPTPD